MKRITLTISQTLLAIGLGLSVSACGDDKSHAENVQVPVKAPVAKVIGLPSASQVKWTGAEFHEQAHATLIAYGLFEESDNFFEELNKCLDGTKKNTKCDQLVKHAKALNDRFDDNAAALLYRFKQELATTLAIANEGSDDVVVTTPIDEPKPIEKQKPEG